MAREHVPLTITFDPEHVMNEWRRFYDWAVLSRQRTETIEAIGCLGQKFSATFSAYRLAKKPQRRAHLSQELLVAFESLRAFYRRIPDTDRIPLTFHRHDL
jgi:hypothetical protein